MRLIGRGRAQGTPRRRRMRQQLRPSPRLLRGLAVLLAGGALAGLWLSGLPARLAEAVTKELIEASAGLGLAVEDVLVEGRNRSGGPELLAALGVKRGSPILALDPVAAKARLEALPWVAGATVERRLPDIVYLRLREREPIALWQLEGNLTVIDSDGGVIEGADPRAHAGLPLVVGQGAPERAAALLALLASEPELAPRVKAAVLVGGRRWNVELEGGVSVRLPERSPGEAWAQLARIVREERLLERDVVVIDLRLPDRLILRTSSGKPPAAPAAKPAAGGQST